MMREKVPPHALPETWKLRYSDDYTCDYAWGDATLYWSNGGGLWILSELHRYNEDEAESEVWDAGPSAEELAAAYLEDRAESVFLLSHGVQCFNDDGHRRAYALWKALPPKEKRVWISRARSYPRPTKPNPLDLLSWVTTELGGPES